MFIDTTLLLSGLTFFASGASPSSAALTDIRRGTLSSVFASHFVADRCVQKGEKIRLKKRRTNSKPESGTINTRSHNLPTTLFISNFCYNTIQTGTRSKKTVLNNSCGTVCSVSNKDKEARRKGKKKKAGKKKKKSKREVQLNSPFEQSDRQRTSVAATAHPSFGTLAGGRPHTLSAV